MAKIDLSNMQCEPDCGECVSILYSPQNQEIVELWVNLEDLASRSASYKTFTIKDVIGASGLLQSYPQLDLEHSGSLGIWGKPATLNTFVQKSDRVEIYRPLSVDPKEARRARYKKQGPIQSRHRPGYKGL